MATLKELQDPAKMNEFTQHVLDQMHQLESFTGSSYWKYTTAEMPFFNQKIATKSNDMPMRNFLFNVEFHGYNYLKLALKRNIVDLDDYELKQILKVLLENELDNDIKNQISRDLLELV